MPHVIELSAHVIVAVEATNSNTILLSQRNQS
jgi:hypothetical protein